MAVQEYKRKQFSVPVNLYLPLSFLHWDGKNSVTSRATCLCFAGKVLEEGTAHRCNLSSPPAKLAQEGWLLLSVSKEEQSSFPVIPFPWSFLELVGNGWFDTSKRKSNCKQGRAGHLKAHQSSCSSFSQVFGWGEAYALGGMDTEKKWGLNMFHSQVSLDPG